MRTRVRSVLLAIVIFAVPSQAASANELWGPLVERNANAIEVVGPELTQVHPADETQASIFSAALQLMMDHPHDFGYPWLDPITGTLEVSAATGEAPRLVRESLAPLLSDTPNSLRNVTHSYADLERISDGIVELSRPGASGAGLVWEIAPDHLHNRLIVSVTEMNGKLLEQFATRFGTAVAVRVAERPETHPGDSRQNNPSPYYGGAQIAAPAGTCSDGFTWANGSLWSGVLTAGHCAPNGGTVTCCSPNQSMGTVTSGSRENWQTGNGTVYYGSETIYRGDVALVQLSSSRSVSVRMWRGAPDSTTSSIVRLVWGRWSLNGDNYCVGGRTTGEICGFRVTESGISHLYSTGEWIRNAVRGDKLDPCPAGGDSGGSVFTLYQDGVAAKGIHSGGGSFLGGCVEYFTDIQHPIQALPGGVPSLP